MSGPEREPNRSSVLELARHDYDQVAAAFRVEPPEMRGGHRRDHETRSGMDLRRADDYHVQSSFNPEQQGYVHVTAIALNMLARGRKLTPDDQTPEALSERIVRFFSAQPAAEASFGQSLMDAILELHDEFGQRYPNLMPALAFMAMIGGIEGTNTAFMSVQTGLADALNDQQYNHYLEPGISGFTGIHPGSPDEPLKYEIWCSGEAFAKSIIRQAQAAATTLAARPEVRASHDDKRGRILGPVFNLDEHLRVHIDQAAQAAALRHGS